MSGTAGGRRPRVLVVEDDDRIRELFVEWLDTIGCAAVGVCSGENGILLFNMDPFELVVTDLMMPGLTGWQVIAALRQRDPDVPVIMITGSATNIDPAHLRASRVMLLEKPVSLTGFKAAVTEALQTRLRPEASQTSGS